MNASSAPPLFADAETNPLRTHVNPCLWFDDRDGYRVVFCRHEVLYRLALTDRQMLALISVMLRQSELATQAEIAAAFGHSVATQRRWETRYRLDGNVDLQAKTSARGRKPALDHSQCDFVRRWFEQGIANLEMAKRLGVSETTIRRVLAQAGLKRQRPSAAELPFGDADETPVVPLDAAFSERAAVSTVVPNCAVVPTLALDTAVAVPSEGAQPDVIAADAGSTAPASSGAAASQVAGKIAVGNAPAIPFTIDCDPTDRSGDRFMARQGLLNDAAPLFGDHEELPRAGVLLAVPVLMAHGGWRSLIGSLAPSAPPSMGCGPPC